MRTKVLTGVCMLCMLCMVFFLAVSPMTLPMPKGDSNRVSDAQQLSEIINPAAETTETRTATPAKDEPLPDGITVWDGTVATAFAGGRGKSTDPYLIANGEQLAYFTYLCNNFITDDDNNGGAHYSSLFYKITDDICLNPDFTVTGNAVEDVTGLRLSPYSFAATRFNGTMNGDGHRIYNYYWTGRGFTGLFGQLYGTVKNLHMVRGYANGVQIDFTIPGGGVLVRELYGIVDSCTVSTTFVFSRNAGGIIGSISGTSAKVTNCQFSGELYVDIAVAGGIVGSYTTRTIVCSITDCINRGSVTAGINEDGASSAGGIIGRVSTGTTPGVGGIDIRRCVNFGTVTSANTGNGYVGGIIGECTGVYSTARQMDHCVNFGDVSAPGANGVGGLIGYFTANGSYINYPLLFKACYQYGAVKGTTDVGGFLGSSNAEVQAVTCGSAGEVTGTTNVGGIVGYLNCNAWSPGNSAVRVYNTWQTCDVTGETAVGGVIGILHCGNSKTSGVFLGGALIAGSVTGKSYVSGVIGEYATSSFSTQAELSLEYSVILPYIHLQTTDSYGIIMGGMQNGVSITTTFGYRLFVCIDHVDCTPEGGTTEIVNNPVLRRGLSTILSDTYDAANLTNGFYLNILNLYANSNSYTRWLAGSELPMHTTVAQLENLDMTRRYDGTASVVTSGDWGGSTAICEWNQRVGDEWVLLLDAPTDVGVYRVRVALVTDRAAGASIIDFEIRKQAFDMSTVTWQDKTELTYNGTEQCVELVGIPESFVVTYRDNTATVVGQHTAQYVSIDDPDGNYEFTGTPAKTTCAWRIDRAQIDFTYVTWSNIPEGGTRPVLTYNEEVQSIYLVDTANPEFDLNAMLDITYSNNTGRVVGDAYYATATTSYDPVNVTVTHPIDRLTTYWSIQKRNINPADYIEFADNTVVYDEAEHSLSFGRGTLPSCVTATADSTNTVHVGANEYEYTYHFTLTDTTNNTLVSDQETRVLTISRAVPRVTAKGKDTTYNNGEIITIDEAACTFSAGKLTVPGALEFKYYRVDESGQKTLVTNGAVNAGEYSVEVIYPGSENFEAVTQTVALYINRATLALNGNIVLRDGNYVWDGTPKNLVLKNEADIPTEIVKPVYSTPQTDVGQYTVVVNFEFVPEMQGNYQPIQPMSATMTILTSILIDEETDLRVQFPEGQYTYMRLLVKERKDVKSFNTVWELGRNTSLKSLYQVELKQGTDPVTETDTLVRVMVPLTREMMSSAKTIAVAITVNEDGTYQIKELKADIDEYDDNDYLIVETTSMTYFGVVTLDENTGLMTWSVFAVCLAIPSGLMTLVGIIRIIRKKKKSGKNNR